MPITDTYFTACTSPPQRAKTLLGLAVAIHAATVDPAAPSFAAELLRSLAKGLGEAWRADFTTLRLHDEAASIVVGGKRYAVSAEAARRLGAEICEDVVLPLLQDLFTNHEGLN